MTDYTYCVPCGGPCGDARHGFAATRAATPSAPSDPLLPPATPCPDCGLPVGHGIDCPHPRDGVDPALWLGTWSARARCPAHPRAWLKHLGGFARCSECGAAVELCLGTFGRKECVLARGHAGDHCSRSGSSWPDVFREPGTPDAVPPAPCPDCGRPFGSHELTCPHRAPHGNHRMPTWAAPGPRGTYTLGTSEATPDPRDVRLAELEAQVASLLRRVSVLTERATRATETITAAIARLTTMEDPAPDATPAPASAGTWVGTSGLWRCACSCYVDLHIAPLPCSECGTPPPAGPHP